MDPLSRKDTTSPNAAKLPKCRKWECILDVTVCLIVFVLLSPAFIAAVLTIKLVSRGPVMYKQKRIGYGGEAFMIYKLRTMDVSSQTKVHDQYSISIIKKDEPLRKLDSVGDNRLIPFGKIIRASGIDELPQVINVLKREMSFIGPRPCLPAEYAAFSSEHLKRFQVLPGLTGLWQVSGKNHLTFKQMVSLDSKYVDEKSIPLYFWILLKTPGVLLGQIFEPTQSAELTPIEKELANEKEKDLALQISL